MSTTPVTLDVPAAAEMLKAHPKTVLDLISKGAIPAGKVGRSYVMLTRDVLAYVEQSVNQQTAARLGAPVRHGKKSARSLPRKLA